ncbi:AMP-binding protein [Roseateles sp. PN1]|uniref:AMP-binding protein n=1 Tax=Roseateles sp. PN1 TaxID=3137372 RepID=UPI00313948B2
MSRTFNLADLFEIVAAAVPDRLAIIYGTRTLSFAALDQRATRLANAMLASGVKRGDRVGIQLHNSPEYLESFFACCKIGAAPVNVNYRYVAEELDFLLRSLEVNALIHGSEFSSTVASVAAALPGLVLRLEVGPSTEESRAGSYEAALAESSDQLPVQARSDDDLYIICTGGTTGAPKGVIWPHKSIFMAAMGGGGTYFGRGPIERPEELSALVQQGPALRYFAAAPLMHAAAMWASLISLFAGHSVVLNDQQNFDAEHVWDLVSQQRVDILSIVGDAMALPLIQALERHAQRWDLLPLRIVGNGGAVFSLQLQQRLKALLPHIAINNGMGSSESGHIGAGNKPAEGDGFMHLPPRPDLAIVGDHGALLRVPGEEGILARSGYTPIGYYGDPVKSAETFVRIEGRLWALTGDRARLADDGGFIVLGRGSQCINTGGEKVFPEEVEEVARHYAAVHDVLVVGLPDERWGQRVCAVVAVEAGQRFELDEFQRICRQHLSAYKVPKQIVLAEKIERSPAGKADYRWARRHALEADA